ncbi:MAG TPA: flavodoxin domain-containing protein [Spirillospora sp.]|nr:flavodoxin domain-containing protein [Spirillospora sp.]
MRILVAYASAHGSTAEIAEFIGRELEQFDFEVTVRNVVDVESVEGYDAFVLGSAIHAQMWLTEMSQFLDRFIDNLRQAPVAFFITCIRVLEPDGYDHVLREYVNHRVLEELNVKDLTAFAGRLELSAVDWEERWTLAACYDGKQPLGSFNSDFRDWEKIRAWTHHIAGVLMPV